MTASEAEYLFAVPLMNYFIVVDSLFRSEFLSVDPYMRPYTARMQPPLTMIGSSVAVVEQSKHPDYPTGTTIVIYAGWVIHTVP